MRMEDIASKAGVSQATVSRVFSGSGGVAKEKRDAVLHWASKLGFKPQARIPRNAGGMRNIGLYFTDLYFTRALSGQLSKSSTIANELPAPYNAILLPMGLAPEKLAFEVARRGILGLFIFGHNNPPALRTALAGIPHVWLNSHDHQSANSILRGNHEAGALAAEHLLQHGCTRLGAVQVPSHNPGFRARIDGFLDVARRADREADVFAHQEKGLFFEDMEIPDLEALLDRLMRDHADALTRCDGLFCPDDRVTAIFYRVLRRHGLSLDRGPHIVSCNNDQYCLAGLFPRPATIHFTPELTARLAIKELLAQLSGESRDTRIAIIIRPELIPGDELPVPEPRKQPR